MQRAVSGTAPPGMLSRWFSSPVAMKQLRQHHHQAAAFRGLVVKPAVTRTTSTSTFATYSDYGRPVTVLAGDSKPHHRRNAPFATRLGSTTRTQTPKNISHGLACRVPVSSRMAGGWEHTGGASMAPSRLMCSASSGGSPADWRDFEEARDYVRSLGLKSHREWQDWSKSGERPHDIPYRSDQVFKDKGWMSWGDFLGYRPGSVAGEWRSFEEARDYVKSLGLKSTEEWQDWMKSGEKPPNIPSSPDRVYKGEGWLSWGDFLGYRPEPVAGEWRTFEEARNYMRSLGLKSKEEWQEWRKSGQMPPDIPSSPDQVYKDKGWMSWGDFLEDNKGSVAGEWRGFEEARDYVKSLGLKSHKEWQEWSKTGERPHDIPSSPDQVYKDKGWLSWGDFLGYEGGYEP